LRFGHGYADFVEAYKKRERFSADEWSQWQHQRLTELLTNAAALVPYYRTTWSDSEKQAARAGRLADLPLLEKSPLRADAKAFLREDLHPRRPQVYHTSGSTGTPIANYWTIPEYRDALALREARSANWAGVSFRMPRATFSGRIVVPDPNSKGPFHRFNIAERQVYLSAFHLSRENAPVYVEALRKHKVQWGTGYAVSFGLLARYILEDRLPAPQLKAIVTTSEKVTASLRAAMQEAFQCRVFEEYSTVESAVFASECEAGSLHVSPDAGIVEILRPDGSPCAPGEPGEVVATCLLRDYQPLIRFRLGDMAAWSGSPCACGRAMPVIQEVLGRIEDVIIGVDGRQMVRFHGIFVDQPSIREGQIIQEALNRIRVKVVAADGFGQKEVDEIVKRVQQRLTDQVQVTVERVESIPRTKAGKFKAVISLLKDQGVAPVETTGIDS